MIPVKAFNKCLTLMPRVCVDIVIICEREVLLLKRAIEPCKGEWCLSGGGIERCIPPVEMAQRKLSEELGLNKIKTNQLLLICVDSYICPSRHDICITYQLTLDRKPPISLDYQHIEYRWFNLMNLPALSPNIVKRQIAQIK